MAVDVDTPPINVPLVDARTGYPTRAMIYWMHRLWLRTGGNTDLIDSSTVDDDTSAEQFGIALLSRVRDDIRDIERDDPPTLVPMLSRLQALVAEIEREMDHSPMAAELAALRRQVAEQDESQAQMQAELARLRKRLDDLETEATL